ncbi:MAG: Uma2 family endonuclease [Acidimicrobiales bacterium]
METVILGKAPPEVEAMLARRRELGQDLLDEVWEGSYHVAPAPHPWHGYVDNLLAELLGPCATDAGLVGTGPFNLGEEGDYRVPDRAYHRRLPSSVWVPTAAIVVEVLSPDDETWAKFGFYARHEVDEICTADPVSRSLQWFSLAGAGYEDCPASRLLRLSVSDLAELIQWPE